MLAAICLSVGRSKLSKVFLQIGIPAGLNSFNAEQSLASIFNGLKGVKCNQGRVCLRKK